MRRHYCLAGEGNHGTSDARDTEQTGRAEGAFIFLYPRPPSLQIVSSILQLQLPDVEGTGAADAMRSAAARVLAIAAVHERLYTGEEAMVVRLDTLLHDLCHEIGRAYGCPDGSIKTDVERVDVPTDMVVPLALIVNELVTNGVKHVGPPCNITLRGYRTRSEAHGLRQRTGAKAGSVVAGSGNAHG